jgi:hypothetical protein
MLLALFGYLHTKRNIYFSNLISPSHITRISNNNFEDAVSTRMRDLPIKVKHSKQLLAILIKTAVLEYPLHFHQMLQDYVQDYLCINSQQYIGEKKNLGSTSSFDENGG